jgi:hypothetical protein
MVSKMRLLLAVLFCSVMLPSAYAEKLPAPTGKPVLTISGKIGNMNVGDKAVFDLAMLEKLGMKTIETTTGTPARFVLTAFPLINSWI